jgi:hypothetical protein
LGGQQPIEVPAEDLGDSASAHEVQAGEPAPSPAA